MLPYMAYMDPMGLGDCFGAVHDNSRLFNDNSRPFHDNSIGRSTVCPRFVHGSSTVMFFAEKKKQQTHIYGFV